MNQMTENRERSQTDAWYLFGIRHPWLILVTGIVLMAALAAGMKHIYKDTRADAFLEADNPALMYKNKVREIFGLSDPLVIAVSDSSKQGIYRPQTLDLIGHLTDQVNQLEWVNASRTISLPDENNIIGSEYGLDVSPFYDLLKSGNGEDIRKAISDFPLYDGMLVSSDGAMSVIVLELYDDAMAEQAYNAVMDITAALDKPDGVNIYVAGEGAVLGFLGHYIDQDASRLNPLAGLIITIMLVVAFRRFLPALLGNMVIAASVLMTVGFMAWCGVPFYVITNAMPVILIGMAVADTIHILSHYYESQARHPQWSLKECLEEALLVMFRPVTLTSLTTIAGFIGLYASAYMPPFEYFGLFTAFGVAIAWLYSVFFLPAMICLLKPKVSKRWIRLEQESRSDAFSSMIAAAGHLSTRNPAVTLAVFLSLAVAGVYMASQLRVNENRINTFHKDEPIYQADKAINAHLEGTNTIDIVIETPENEGVFEPEVLKKMEALQAYAESLPHVNGSVSVVDYLKQMNKSLNEGNPEYYRLPDDKNLVAQYFLLYSASGDPTDFEEEIDYDYRLANIRLNLDTAEFIATRPVIESLQTYIDRNFNSEQAKATLSGRVNVNYHWIKDIGVSHFTGVAISLIFVCIVSALLFRSVIAGLMATAPVVCSILMVYSAMSLLHIDLGIGTSMFASVAIGLGIDFAIHTLDRIKALVDEGYDDMKALLDELYRSTGRALLFNFLALAFGFGVLITSRVVPLTHFGTIVVLSVTMSFVAALTLLPAMVLVFRPGFIFRHASVQPQIQVPVTSAGSTAAILLVPAILTALVAGALLFSGHAHASGNASLNGRDIAERINAVDDGQYVSSDMQMILTDKNNKERKREVISYRKYFGDEKKTVIFYKTPNNLKGTGFLTFDYPSADIDDDQWLYLPAMRKVRRISASDRGDYFMGTDLTYEDIKQNGRLDLNDYNFTALEQEMIDVDGSMVNAQVVEATPRTDEIAEELGYGRLKFWVNPDNWIIVKTEYWDPKGKPLKTYLVSDIRMVDGVWTRHKFEVDNHLTGHRSLFLFSNVDYRSPVPDRLFTKSSLVRGL